MDEQNVEDMESESRLELHNALCFLALSGADKLSYLPGKFPELQFHLNEGDLLTDNPLVFMAAICNQECRKHTGNTEADDLLKCIEGVLEAMDHTGRNPLWHPQEIWAGGDLWYAPSIKVWDALGYLAKGALEAIGWEVTTPPLKCADLLDRDSYGAYSALSRGNA
jgi:hypothetical protein